MPAFCIKAAVTSLIAALLLAGCVTAPPKPQSFASLGQFEQYQLNSALYRIRFTGDADMRVATAEEIALLKAAKTTLDAGYRYFRVIDQSKSAPSRHSVVYPDGFSGNWATAWYGPYGLHRVHNPYYGRGWYGPDWHDPFYEGRVYNLDPVDVSYTIRCSSTASPQGEEFDARLVMASLGPKYYLNADGTPRVQPPAQKP